MSNPENRTLKEMCKDKKNKKVRLSWDEVNEMYGQPYKNGESLRGAYKAGTIVDIPKPIEGVKNAEDLIQEEKEKQEAKRQQKIERENVKVAAQVSVIADRLEQACKVVKPYRIIKVDKPTVRKRDRTTPIFLFSDVQAGQKNSAEAMGTEHDFNHLVIADQMKQLLKGIASITFKQLKEQKLLQILMLGDMVDGLGIFPGQAFHQDIDLYEAFFYLAEIVSKLLQELLQIYDNIEIYTVPGNHGRVGKRGETPHYLNWDNFWYKHMEQKMQNFPQIKWHITKAWWQLVETRGKVTFITHGDTIRSYRGLPFYGIERKDGKQTKLFASRGKHYDYMAIGHFHQNTELPSPTGPIFINGSFPGGSVFSEKDLSTANRPQQKIFGVHEEHGKTWSFPIYLDY